MGRSEKCGAQGGAPRTWRIWRCPWRMRAAGAGARPGAARMRGTAAVGAGWRRLARRGASRRTTPGGCDGAPGRAGRAGPPGAGPTATCHFFAIEPPASRRAPQSATLVRLQPLGGSVPRPGASPLTAHATIWPPDPAAPASRFNRFDPRCRHGTDERRRVGTRREGPRAGGTPAGRAAWLADHHRPQLTAAWRGAPPRPLPRSCPCWRRQERAPGGARGHGQEAPPAALGASRCARARAGASQTSREAGAAARPLLPDRHAPGRRRPQVVKIRRERHG